MNSSRIDYFLNEHIKVGDDFYYALLFERNNEQAYIQASLFQSIMSLSFKITDEQVRFQNYTWWIENLKEPLFTQSQHPLLIRFERTAEGLSWTKSLIKVINTLALQHPLFQSSKPNSETLMNEECWVALQTLINETAPVLFGILADQNTIDLEPARNIKNNYPSSQWTNDLTLYWLVKEWLLLFNPPLALSALNTYQSKFEHSLLLNIQKHATHTHTDLPISIYTKLSQLWLKTNASVNCLTNNLYEVSPLRKLSHAYWTKFIN